MLIYKNIPFCPFLLSWLHSVLHQEHMTFQISEGVGITVFQVTEGLLRDYYCNSTFCPAVLRMLQLVYAFQLLCLTNPGL